MESKEVMLHDVLRIISESGMINMPQIAEQTGATEPMIQQAINLLISKGYLALVDTNQKCDKAYCASCGCCDTQAQIYKNTYFVTEKGKKYLQST